LIYKAISAWYVDVTAIKEQMIKNNQKITWVPDDIKN
jgi:isoleucine--tRNA ligase